MGNYEAIVIGVSAGGMDALSVLLPMFPADFHLPVIVVQHRMSEEEDFLAEYLNNKSRIYVVEATPNEKIKPGTVYLAPGGYHLLVEPECVFSLSVDAPVCYSIPSIDVYLKALRMFIKTN